MKLEDIRRKAKIKPSASELASEDRFFDNRKKNAPGSYEMVPLDKIDFDPNNPRTSMDPDALEQLANSIREKGLIHPVNLLQTEDGRFRVEEGHRRVEAAKIAGQDRLPAIVIMDDDLTDEEVRERQLIENLHNEALSPIDAGRAMQSLIKKHKLTVRDLAKQIALPRSTVQEYVGILRIPDELLELAKTLPKMKLVEISAAPVSEMSALIDQALSGATIEQVKTLRREKKPLTHFRRSYKLKSWIENKSPNKVTIELKNIEADEDPKALVGKILSTLAREIKRGDHSPD